MTARDAFAYPVLLDLRGRRCLVVGGGRVAARKVDGLVAAGAVVDVVAPIIATELDEIADRAPAQVTLVRRPYVPDEVRGYRLVITATDDCDVQQVVFEDGERANVWVNAADDPERCAFILPAVHRRPPVTVAVSTGGASPALAQWLRDCLADALPVHLEDLVARVAAERAAIRATGRSSEGLDWRSRIDAILASLDTRVDAPQTGPE